MGKEVTLPTLRLAIFASLTARFAIWLMKDLPLGTWIRFVVWLVIGVLAAFQRGYFGDDREVVARLRAHDVDLVCLAGFLQLLVIPDDYLGRVLNIHPALIPAFCGRAAGVPEPAISTASGAVPQ